MFNWKWLDRFVPEENHVHEVWSPLVAPLAPQEDGAQPITCWEGIEATVLFDFGRAEMGNDIFVVAVEAWVHHEGDPGRWVGVEVYRLRVVRPEPNGYKMFEINGTPHSLFPLLAIQVKALPVKQRVTIIQTQGTQKRLWMALDNFV